MEIKEMVSFEILEQSKYDIYIVKEIENNVKIKNTILDDLFEDPLLIRDLPYDLQTEDIVRTALDACRISPGINPSDLEKYIKEDLKEIVREYRGYWGENSSGSDLVWIESQ